MLCAVSNAFLVNALLLALVTASKQAASPAKKDWLIAGGSVQTEVVGDAVRLARKGWIRSTREFLDQRIELDFRIPQTDSEGSLVVRGVVWRPGDGPASGYRVGLTSTKRRQIGEIEPISSRSRQDEFHEARITGADWQHLEVTAVRDEVITKLNGEIVSKSRGSGTPGRVRGTRDQSRRTRVPAGARDADRGRRLRRAERR